MGFQIIDPSEGRFSPRGRSALVNTVRLAKTGDDLKVIRVTVSSDLLEAFDIKNGDKINVSIGTDDDRGSIFIAKTTAKDPMAYTIYRPGKQARAMSVSISASKIYGLALDKPVDCLVSTQPRGILAKLPTSALPHQAMNGTADHHAQPSF